MTDHINNALQYLELKDTLLAAEFGCGMADFTLALAKKLDKGRIYALDIQAEKLSALKGRITIAKVNNIIPILCDLEANNGSTLHDHSLDIVVIPNVLFQTENKSAILKEAIRILKLGGQLMIIDWLKEGPFSPKEGMVSPNDVKKMADELGLSLRREFAVGEYHYGLLFITSI